MTTARQIVTALSGNWHGSYGTVRCPSHKDANPSLKVSDDPRKDDGIDLHCFAGCDWRDIKDTLQNRGLLNGRQRQGSGYPKLTIGGKRLRGRRRNE